MTDDGAAGVTTPTEGSFNKYLHHSGDFVKTVALAIQRADPENLERLRRAFPQMVAAFRRSSWEEAPPGFAAHYQAEELEPGLQGDDGTPQAVIYSNGDVGIYRQGEWTRVAGNDFAAICVLVGMVYVKLEMAGKLTFLSDRGRHDLGLAARTFWCAAGPQGRQSIEDKLKRGEEAPDAGTPG